MTYKINGVYRVGLLEKSSIRTSEVNHLGKNTFLVNPDEYVDVRASSIVEAISKAKQEYPDKNIESVHASVVSTIGPDSKS